MCVLFPGPNLTPWPLPLRYIALTECRPGSQTLTHKHTHTLETVARELLETSKSETPVNCSHTAVYTLCPPAPTPACRRCTGTSRWDLPLCHSAFWIQRFNPCPADVPPTQPVSRSQPGEWRDTNTAISSIHLSPPIQHNDNTTRFGMTSYITIHGDDTGAALATCSNPWTDKHTHTPGADTVCSETWP